MRVHLDCAKAGSSSRVQLTIPFNRNKDSAGYSVTQSMLGDQFTALSSCKISTTQVFFPFGKELEIPTESMGCEYPNCTRWRKSADELSQWTTSTYAYGKECLVGIREWRAGCVSDMFNIIV
jgi:hypothetical protein